MTATDLEHAATAPAKFLHRLHLGDQDESLKAYRESFIDFKNIGGALDIYGVRSKFTSLYVVPGGRFLITDHLKKPDGLNWMSCLNMWDVGYLSIQGSPNRATPIASIDSCAAGNQILVHPTHDGKGLLVFARHDKDCRGRLRLVHSCL